MTAPNPVPAQLKAGDKVLINGTVEGHTGLSKVKGTVIRILSNNMALVAMPSLEGNEFPWAIPTGQIAADK